MSGVAPAPSETGPDDFLSQIVRLFLDSKLSLLLILFALLVGVGALVVTPREEDPQIVVPLADVQVAFPGASAAEVEQLVATPLEKLLFQIDGVEYVYSLSQDGQALVTVRFYVGQDRERSLVKLFKKIQENLDIVPPGVTGWALKPIEIDDVPVVTLTLAGEDAYQLRRVAEEVGQRLSAIGDLSRATVVGGPPRVVHVRLDPDRLAAYQLSPTALRTALAAANVRLPAGELVAGDTAARAEGGLHLSRPEELNDLVVGVFDGRPVFLKDVADVQDGPQETEHYVRYGRGPAWALATAHGEAAGASAEAAAAPPPASAAVRDVASHETRPAVTLALSKKRGTSAVTLAQTILEAVGRLRREGVIPDDIALTVTRNYGHTADEKVNELIEALVVAVVIVIALLSVSLGWRAALVVAIAIPVVFGLTLAVNWLCGYTINRVTLFALIVALGLLVDDPIVDVENIARHFELRGRSSPAIVLEAVAEIRPPLISATLAVIVSFLPLFFIRGMMGPYMSPMALNVPVSMLMSMLVAFTITPWLSLRLLRPGHGHAPRDEGSAAGAALEAGTYDPETIRRSRLYRFFRPLMLPLVTSRARAGLFLLAMLGLTLAAMGLAAVRAVPLKMLPYDNKNELLVLLDMPEGTSLERTDAVVRQLEHALAGVREVVDFTSYVGVAGPIDFNGLVRHYYLRSRPHLAEIRVNLVGKKQRRQQSHAIGLRLRDAWTALAAREGGLVRIVEIPPGPPVLAGVVAEVYGRPEHSYDDLLAAAETVAERMRLEPGLVEVDTVAEAPQTRWVFVPDQEKAALHGITSAQIAETIQIALAGEGGQTVHLPRERYPLRMLLRLPQPLRSRPSQLDALLLAGAEGQMVPLAELGRWEQRHVGQTIYHKNLERVVYVLAEAAGRPPAECVVDLSADQRPASRSRGAAVRHVGSGWVASGTPRPLSQRTYFTPGGGLAWAVPDGIDVRFAGEGEWDITLDVFFDLGLAFVAAMGMIYIILVAQMKSLVVPLIVMLAIPLTVLGVMPGFWLLTTVSGQTVGGYADPVYFTATAMIGMIALAGIVTRDSIILVDFIQAAVARGRPLVEAILESRVVRLRPILLTAGAATLASLPITIDPIFSGLGWSIIFGLVASTVFTLFVIPVTYWLAFAPGSSPQR
jgi:multidrug efflux pump subunit AcrB